MKPKAQDSKALRYLFYLVNGILFLINFLLFYLISVNMFPGAEGMARIIPCWILAYALTWIMVYLTRGAGRLLITLLFLIMLTVVLLARP